MSTGEALRQGPWGRGLELRETHISWVFLAEHGVWKIKKPVDLGFLDFTTLEKRRQACEAEVRLNRRLAPAVYFGIAPICRRSSGELVVGPPGGAPADEVVDWAVHMQRLADRCRADRLLQDGLLDGPRVDQVASLLADFHRQAPTSDEIAHFGRREVIGRNIEENFDQTRAVVARYLSDAEALEIEGWQRDFLERHGDRFDRRQTSGKVRDGHGDLRLDHIYFGGSEAEDADIPSPAGEEREAVTIIDCIEFNHRFRFADTCADIAFLAMDLSWNGRADLAERFLASYAMASGDYDFYPLVDFYESYRAFVRAKIATFLAEDRDATAVARQRAANEARRYFLLALASERRALLAPRVVAVGGIIGAGKSTVAREISHALGAPIVDADHTRKELAGVEAETPLRHGSWQGAYTPERSQTVYAEVFRRGAEVLTSGRPLVLDASFRSREHRWRARQLARRFGVPFLFVECQADPATCRQRLRQRESRQPVSDGRLEIFDDFVARFENVTELANDEHLVLDTRRPLGENLEILKRTLPTWPEGLVS